MTSITLTQLIKYIESDWPTISDANSCARWILKQADAGLFPENYGLRQVNICCSFWSRHEHD
jgi:hypothetical protein